MDFYKALKHITIKFTGQSVKPNSPLASLICLLDSDLMFLNYVLIHTLSLKGVSIINSTDATIIKCFVVLFEVSFRNLDRCADFDYLSPF